MTSAAKDEDEKLPDPGYSRRISRLDDVGKFQASLDAVKVNNPRSGSFSANMAPANAPVVVDNAV